jgi:ClpA/ClpB-like protein
MDTLHSHRDCQLSIRDAQLGDLPPVCIRCGDGTNELRSISLYYRGKFYFFRLPLCDPDFTTGRRRQLMLIGSLFGLGLLASGVLAIVWAVNHQAARLTPLTGLVGLCMLALGLLIGLGFWVWHVLGHDRSIHIKRLDGQTVTLARVAPAFVEALRIHNEESAWRTSSGEQAPCGEQPPPWPDANLKLGIELREIAHAAAKEARALGHDYVGTEHLLLALCSVPTAGAIALEQAGLKGDHVREEIRKECPGSGTTPPSISATPRLRKIVDPFTQADSRAGADSLLLALLRESDTEAVQIVVRLGADPELLCEKLLKLQPPITAASQNPRAP